MKTSSKVLYGTLLAVLVMAAPLAAQARPGGGHGGAHNGGVYDGGPYMERCAGMGMAQAIPAEKQQAFAALMRQHSDKMQPLREQIWTKKTTLRALSGNPTVEPKEITTLVNELSGLRTQAYAERKAFAERVKKEVGVDLPYGHGGGMGFQRHRGNGGPRGQGHGGGHW